MSDQPPVPPRDQRPEPSLVATIFLIFLGIVLLLPGLCSVIFFSVFWQFPSSNPNYSFVFLVLLVTLAIGAGGVGLIVFAIRRR